MLRTGKGGRAKRAGRAGGTWTTFRIVSVAEGLVRRLKKTGSRPNGKSVRAAKRGARIRA